VNVLSPFVSLEWLKVTSYLVLKLIMAGPGRQLINYVISIQGHGQIHVAFLISWPRPVYWMDEAEAAHFKYGTWLR